MADIMTKRGNGSLSYSLRYICFPLRHWGVYLDMLPACSVQKSSVEAFKEQLKKSYFIQDDRSQASDISTTFNIGIVYRVETGKWVFLPRIGFGNAGLEKQTLNLQVKGIDNNEAYQITAKCNKAFSNSLKIPNLTTGIGIYYKLSKVIYLAADAGYTQMLKRPTFIYEKKDLYSDLIVEQVTDKARLGKNFYFNVGLCISMHLRNKNKTESSTTLPVQ